MTDSKILLAKIGAAHGIRGEVRVLAFGEAGMLDRYGQLHDASGTAYKITAMRVQKTMLVVKFKGINTRNDAEVLNGVELFIERAKLPKISEVDEFYVQDLIGMDVLDKTGTLIGTVRAVANFGAGDLLEIAPCIETGDNAGGGFSPDTYFMPFTRKIVPDIDFGNCSLTVIPPLVSSERDEAE